MIKVENPVIKTPFTQMELLFEDDVLVGVTFFSRRKLLAPQSEKAKNTCQQIYDYCSKQLVNLEFDIDLRASGTPFQMKVWRALSQIPLGQVRTYGELARQLKTSARAVGNACRANPVPLVIPCHRVVSKSGMGGFAGKRKGEPMTVKAWLLKHEGVAV